MKVKELIEILQNEDQEMEVVTCGIDYFNIIDAVDHITVKINNVRQRCVLLNGE